MYRILHEALSGSFFPGQGRPQESQVHDCIHWHMSGSLCKGSAEKNCLDVWQLPVLRVVKDRTGAFDAYSGSDYSVVSS